ncbi:uncharacterized protein LOC105762232 [Gossypium raimondii]|uniref:uncharacterized protein LOC105762232 n=1 Tax=Gossypium raimondii TaxID=29730 RepID=UPI00227BE929|nr:uncharacterized protein LOC105762232 [Gossypium raimondii]
MPSNTITSFSPTLVPSSNRPLCSSGTVDEWLILYIFWGLQFSIAALNSASNNESPVAALNSASKNDWMKQSLVNNVIGSTMNQSNLIQPWQYDVCNVVCKTKDVCKRHLMGKNHPRNLQAMINPLIFGASGVANFHELDRKKQQLLNAGAPVGSIRLCTICNVACNSHDAFVKHLSGRRHVAQVRLIAIDGIGPYLAAIQANDQFWNKGKKITKNKISQPTWCEVCQINCNSSNVYAKHLSGKKHLKNLQNLEKSKNSTCYSSSIDTPIAANLVIGAVENPAADGCSGADAQKSKKMIARSEAAKEDLETKKQKVIEGGAAATAIRVCVICNVVCNSQTVFNYHLTGQKHATMVKKLANGRIPTDTSNEIKTDIDREFIG